MIFETSEDYHRERKKLSKLDNRRLEKLLGELFHKRYIEQDINYESYYRLASSVYSQRKMDSKMLIFHMKKFIF